jgi:peptidyl-prolyl cis-trans isomerase SurA
MKIIFAFLISFVAAYSAYCQSFMVDKIIAVVGKSSILYSDIEEQYLQAKAQGELPDKCVMFEDMLAQKLLVTQAGIDSIEVTEGEVELELEQRLTYFINQIGNEEKLVEYFGKSILEIKEDMRESVRDQILMRKMQSEIVKSNTITPKEVKDFYSGIPSDSLPYINSQIELNQIVIYPKTDEQAIFDAKEKLLKIRERILNGENFATMAVLYSEDPGASRGGDIGWASKTELDPAYFKAAFALKPGQISKIVESSFGFHLIQLQDKTDDRVKTRHILIKPKVSIDAKMHAKNKLDSLARIIRLDSLSFERAALYYSQDEHTRLNGGLRINPATQDTKFKVDEFPTSEYYVIRNLQIGEISQPFESTDEKGKIVYKIIQLRTKTDPHKANLKQDFDLLKEMALQKKKATIIDNWVESKAKDVYIKIEEPYNTCIFRIKSWVR